MSQQPFETATKDLFSMERMYKNIVDTSAYPMYIKNAHFLPKLTSRNEQNAY